jgi:E3 ubiquitin-protein ligase CCNP1IP1
LDKVVNEANTQLQNLQNKIQSELLCASCKLAVLIQKSGLTIDSHSLQQKNSELIDLYHEKSKKQAQTQHLYDTLKKRILMSQVETAASDNVVPTFKSTGSGTRPETVNGISFAQAGGLGVNAVGERQSRSIPVNKNGVEQLHRHQRHGSSSQTCGDVAAMPPPDHIPSRHRVQDTTPRHRTQLPSPRPAAIRSQIPMSTARPTFPREHRPPGSGLRNSLGSAHVNRHSLGSSSGFGFSVGMKVGRAPDTRMDEIDRHERSYGQQYF